MSLYLCVFEEDSERASVEVGPYRYFGAIRDLVREQLAGEARFPRFMSHTDSFGEWSLDSLPQLEAEFETIQRELAELPRRLVEDDAWYVVMSGRLRPKTLAEAVFDVDGLPLFEQLLKLIRYAQAIKQPILFQ